AAVADRLIKWVARCGRAEGFAITTAETLDRIFVQQGFGSGEKGEAVDAARGALISGIEAADRFDLVSEKVEAQWLLLATRKEIDDAATNGEFAAVVHRVGTDTAVALKHFGQFGDRDPFFRCEAGDELPDAEGREGALGQRVEGG